MLSFKEYLLEYLTDEQRARYKDIQMTPKARKHTDHYFGEGNDQVREEIPGLEQDKSEVHKAVERHLGVAIPHEHYRAGRFINEKGNQVRIGKVIKDKDLLKQFNEDNTRSGGKKSSSGHYATIVRGTEVAGQTNSAIDKNHPKGHAWGEESCKNVDSGSNRRYLKNEIKHGSVVYRAHDHTGQEIYRATLHPFHDKHGNVMYNVDSEYGLKHPKFSSHAREIANKLSVNAPKDTSYHIHPKVYDNSGASILFHPEATGDHITKALDDEDEDVDVRSAAIRHPNATQDHITKALDDKEQIIRYTAIRHPNATQDHITKALDDKEPSVRYVAIHHPNASQDNIAKALDDKDSSVRSAAIRHPNATPDHITKALDDEDVDVRSAAIRHPNASKDNIAKALDDKDSGVRYTAIRHPNATQDHINKALDDKDSSVRYVAIHHSNASKDNITKALDDKDVDVSSHALKLLNQK